MKKKEPGSFRRNKSGGWEYRIYYKNEYDERKLKSFTAKTKEGCLDKAKAFLDKHKMYMKGIAIDATIPELLREKFTLDFEKGYTREQGYDRCMKTIDIIERHDLGKMPIIDVELVHIDAFLRFITKYSNNTIRKVYSMLCTAFKLAIDQKVIEENLMTEKSLRCPKSKKKDRVVKGLTEEEQKKMLNALEAYKVPKGRNNYKTQLLIELYSGLRMGEINALKPSDIKLTEDGGGFIHVERTVSRGIDSRPFISDSTKTEAGVRDVPISKPLLPIIKKALADTKKNPYGLIFYDYIKGGIIETTQVNLFYRRLCEKADIPFNGQHALRHTFATRCIESGIPAVVLKHWLGHTDIHITLDTYSDVFDRMNSKAVEKFNSYMDTIYEC